MGMLTILYYYSRTPYSRVLLLIFLFLNPLALIVSRAALRALLRYRRARGWGVSRAAIIGTGRLAQETFDPETEVLPVIGSKEGIGHIPLCFIDPGDLALVPDPGYPVYTTGPLLADGTTVPLPLLPGSCHWAAGFLLLGLVFVIAAHQLAAR